MDIDIKHTIRHWLGIDQVIVKQIEINRESIYNRIKEDWAVSNKRYSDSNQPATATTTKTPMNTKRGSINTSSSRIGAHTRV